MGSPKIMGVTWHTRLTFGHEICNMSELTTKILVVMKAIDGSKSDILRDSGRGIQGHSTLCSYLTISQCPPPTWTNKSCSTISLWKSRPSAILRPRRSISTLPPLLREHSERGLLLTGERLLWAQKNEKSLRLPKRCSYLSPPCASSQTGRS